MIFMGKHRFIEIKGRVIELHGNAPVRVLSEEETKEIRRRATPQYKAKHLTHAKLLNEYLESLMRGKMDDAMIYHAEILTRMSNK